MKSSWLKLFVVGLVCVCISGLSAGAKEKAAKEGAKKEAGAKEQVTVSGAAKAVANKEDATKKHLEVTDKAGVVYKLLSRKITADEVTKYDGKNITAKGSVKENKDGTKTLYVSGEIEEAK